MTLKRPYLCNKKVLKSPKKGRPVKYTPELRHQFSKYITEGFAFTEACETVGIHRVTGWRWLKRYPKFSKSVNNAEEKFKSDSFARFIKEITEYQEAYEKSLSHRLKFRTPGNYPEHRRDARGRFIS